MKRETRGDAITTVPARFSDERWTDRELGVASTRDRLLALRGKKDREAEREDAELVLQS